MKSTWFLFLFLQGIVCFFSEETLCAALNAKHILTTDDVDHLSTYPVNGLKNRDINEEQGGEKEEGKAEKKKGDETSSNKPASNKGYATVTEGGELVEYNTGYPDRVPQNVIGLLHIYQKWLETKHNNNGKEQPNPIGQQFTTGKEDSVEEFLSKYGSKHGSHLSDDDFPQSKTTPASMNVASYTSKPLTNTVSGYTPVILPIVFVPYDMRTNTGVPLNNEIDPSQMQHQQAMQTAVPNVQNMQFANPPMQYAYPPAMLNGYSGYPELEYLNL